MKYLSEASVLYIFLTLDIKGIKDIRLISSQIHAPSHELEDTDTDHAGKHSKTNIPIRILCTDEWTQYTFHFPHLLRLSKFDFFSYSLT